MADKASKSSKYKANERFFEWVPEDSPDVLPYMKELKISGKYVDLKKLSPQRLKWATDNKLLIKE